MLLQNAIDSNPAFEFLSLLAERMEAMVLCWSKFLRQLQHELHRPLWKSMPLKNEKKIWNMGDGSKTLSYMIPICWCDGTSFYQQILGSETISALSHSASISDGIHLPILCRCSHLDALFFNDPQHWRFTMFHWISRAFSLMISSVLVLAKTSNTVKTWYRSHLQFVQKNTKSRPTVQGLAKKRHSAAEPQ